jgi:hypothetical protein
MSLDDKRAVMVDGIVAEQLRPNRDDGTGGLWLVEIKSQRVMHRATGAAVDVSGRSVRARRSMKMTEGGIDLSVGDEVRLLVVPNTNSDMITTIIYVSKAKRRSDVKQQRTL